MRKTIVAIVLPLALMFSACAPQVTAGEISDKNYTEAYTTEEEIMEQECEREKRTTGTGKNKKTTYVNECEDEPTGEFETIEHPAVWEFVLVDEDENTGEVEVTEDVFNSYEVGDFYDSEAN